MADEYVISVVLEGKAGSLTSATDKGSESQKRLKQSTQGANIEFLAQVARYQAMTAALNQTIGGLNKLAGGLEAIGFEKTAEGTRKFTKLLELFAGPAEIYLAYLTFTIAMGKKDVTTKGAQTASTGVLAAATAKLNVVMALNPFILIAVAIVVLILALVYLEKKFGVITKSVDMLNEALFKMEKFFGNIRDAIGGLVASLDAVGDAIMDNPLTKGLAKAGAAVF